MFQRETDGTWAKFRFKSAGLAEPNYTLRICHFGSLRRDGMGKAEQYRHHAAECFRLAQQAQDPEEKNTLLGMAAAWRRLAEHVESSGEDHTEV
jgi:hypothetical protein